jgi:excisionase family DNA binding protein
MTSKAQTKRGTTAPDAAHYAGVSIPAIYSAIKSGDLKSKKMGRRTIILPEWVDAWIESLPDAKETLNDPFGAALKTNAA